MAKKVIPEKTPMPEQAPLRRITNFDEVALGYDDDQAVLEASRCLQCKKPVCIAGCPVGIDIPAFVDRVAQGDFIRAAEIIRTKNALPAVCGRVCPQESQCELVCVMGKKYQPIAIGRLERFVADYVREQSNGKLSINILDKQNKSVAVVGGGPAGLTVAGELIQLGYRVTVFEALHKLGGVLVYGIPEFRLPKAILQAEVDQLAEMGVEFRTNHVVGRTELVDELLGRYDAVFIGTGAGLPYFMNVPGENLNGVYSANEFLTRLNLMRAYRFPEWDTPIKVGKRVAVIGGGNTAMDAVRTAKRMGAEHAYLVYRRSRTELPARAEEVHHAEAEGIEFRFLEAPVAVKGNTKGWVTGIEIIKMQLGEPDDSGRRRPAPIENSNYTLEVDTVVVAIGQGPNPLIPRTTPGLKTGRHGIITIDPETGATSKPGVFAGGDVATGGATVILAMGAGKKAAQAIHEFLR
ncbi:NADPH-dependent glutamate synthase [candidate division KSB1 bacterium]|nr:MAG: NADPH-dependent glutamate synthase [candidate division KSB1 bacterium]MBC6948633.1 NADPH-dependent glutamate synthase [candidate division KSB1 bacterium]MCE7941953.1 NADPH-dependent glutamate synthase [Chlorobi bacterium CHB1]MDL1879033.1 NADPH-dependent glutamate synthase [Cytophagia bacterium CHB2]